MDVRKTVVVLSLYLSYTMYVYVRRSVSFAMPAIADSGTVDKGQLGLMVSSQLLAYTLSKFVCGVLVDAVSPKLLLCWGLLASGVSAVAFSVVGTVELYTAMWFLNGLANGPGWPAIAVILKAWFPHEQFGTAWSVMSTSMNIAGTVGPMLTAYIIVSSGWRASILYPGLVCVVWAFLVAVLVQDKPDQSPYKGEEKTEEKANHKQSISRWKLFQLPGFTGICLTYMAISFVQYGTAQWGPLFLVQENKHSIVTGNSYLSSLEVGGIIGSVLAGYSSDLLLKMLNTEPRPIVRQMVISWFSGLLIIFLILFTYLISAQSSVFFVNLVGFCIGFSIYGPVAIFGVVAMEAAPDNLSGTAHAVASVFANAGQTLSGLPLSYIAKVQDWQTVFLIQTAVVIAMVVYLFLYTIFGGSRTEVEAEEKKEK